MLMQVIARLGSPVMLREPLHLDGILTAVHPDCVGGHIDRSTPEQDIKHPSLPVMRLTHSGITIGLTTAEILPKEAKRRSTHLTRRPDGDDLDYLTKPHNVASGPRRNLMARYPVVETPRLTWLVYGNIDGVKRLIRRAESVGGARKSGYGTVLEWEVQPFGEGDIGNLFLINGAAARNLPASWCTDNSAAERSPVIPPYWHPASKMPAIRRGNPCIVRPEILERLYALDQ